MKIETMKIETMKIETTIDVFEVGSAWVVTTECKRVAKILSTGTVDVEVRVDPRLPPIKQTRRIVTALVCTPSKPVPGHVTDSEADQNLYHRLDSKELFEYDHWQETWIETPRERYIVQGGKPRQIENDWIWVVTVHRVVGRAAIHEAHASPYKLGPKADRDGIKIDSGTTIEAVLIPPDDVHPQLFDELGKDEKTQSEIDKQKERGAWIDEYKKEEAAKAKEARRGDPAKCVAWGGASVLKMHLNICGLEKPDKDSGHFNETSRTLLKQYLQGLGIDPWDVMDLGRPEFQGVIDNARKALVV